MRDLWQCDETRNKEASQKCKDEEGKGWTVRGKQGEYRKRDREGGDRMENRVGV